jgi:hypothetical protein
MARDWYSKTKPKDYHVLGIKDKGDEQPSTIWAAVELAKSIWQ